MAEKPVENEMTEEHHEDFHMPGPSIAPLLIGLGFTLTAVGIVYTVMLFIGISILAVGVGIWTFGKYE